MKSFKRLVLTTAVSFICSISGIAQNENSLHFDAINDFVNLPAGAHTGITANGTLEAWIKTSANNSGYRGLVVRSSYYGLFLIDNKLSTFVWGGSATGATTYNTVSLNDGIWHHVALRFQIGVTNGTQMYLDGQPVGPAITLNVTTASNNFQMGCNTNVQFFNGQLDNVKIYSRALSPSEINDSYNCLPVNNSGLNASYNFNQGVAGGNNTGVTTLSDQSGNNNNGTLSNFAFNGSTSNWVNGKSCCFLSTNITGTTIYCQGQTMNLTASFVVYPGVSITGYQWKKNGVNLTNGGNVSGATSANLQIANIVSSDFDSYSVEVTTTCGVGINSVNITESGIINVSNLTAYYPFNNSSSADASGNNYNATATATTSANNRFNQANSAFSFNGTSSTVTIAAPTGQTILGNGQNKSISLWFKRSSSTSKGMLIGYHQASPGSWNPLAYISSDGVLRGWMYQGGSFPWSSGTPIDTNWHHLALVYTTNTQTAFLDGSQVATMNGTLSPGASNIIQIGNGYANTGIPGISTTGNQPFSGVIDEVRFYNAVLTPTEINALRRSPFLITNQPQNQSVCVGETANLSLNVLTPEAGSTLAYQWTFNGTPLSNGGSISGVNTNNLQISNFQVSNVGTYNCIVSPGCNEATSSNVSVSVGTGNVSIIQQPQSTQACQNSAVALSVVTQGAAVTYQWKKNGVAISGATNATLNLTNVSSSDAGNYIVDIVGGSCGTFSSQVAALTVQALPTAVISTATPSICQGGVATLTASGGVSYVWGGTLGISGVTQNVTPSSATTYTVTVTDANGCQASTSQTITVINTPSPTGSSAQTFCSGATVADLIANGSSIAWYANSIGGAPLSSSDVLGNEIYYASQTVNGCESINRLGVAVTVIILNSSVTQTGNTLTAAQSGANYTWVDCNNGNQPIAGANGQSFTPTANGSYAVEIVLNGCSAISSCVQIGSVGLEEDKLDWLTIQPNPTSGMLMITVSQPTNAVVSAANGKVIATLKLEGETVLDATKFATGVYYIRTSEGQTVRFIKQ
jgi:hypothetical protein